MRHYLENHTRLSESILWQMQREFFIRLGIQSWDKRVPFYITSNPFIANSYAEIVATLLLDLKQQNRLDNTKPMYLLELGTGSGKFSYLFLKALHKQLDNYGISDSNFCYIMSDFNDYPFPYWQKNDYFQTLIDNKNLEFAVYDLEKSDNIELHFSKKMLHVSDFTNPLVIFGNYIFDTVKHDGFMVHNHKLAEITVRPYSTNQLTIDELIPIMKDEINLEYTSHNVSQPRSYYDDTNMQEVLNDYVDQYSQSSFLIPIDALKSIKTLSKVTGGNFMLIASDKADILINHEAAPKYPHIAFHGSFSLNVNFDAIGRYLQKLGGNYTHQKTHIGLRTSVFTLGNIFNQKLNFTNITVERSLNQFGPSDYFALYKHMKNTIDKASLEQIVGLIKLSHFDPTFYSFASDKINELLQNNLSPAIVHLFNFMDKVIDNFYYLPSADDIFFSLGLTNFYLQRYNKAIEYYQKSISHYGASYYSCYNLAVCTYCEKNFDASMDYIEQAINYSKVDSKQFIDATKFKATLKREMPKYS